MRFLKLILPLSILIIISSLTYAYFIPSTYGSSLNDIRKNLNLSEINNDWRLDSIWTDKKGLTKAHKITDINYFFNFKTEVYYQSWTKLNTGKTVQQEKEITYIKSFWFWENKIISEGHSYYLPISKNQFQDLYIHYEFDTKNRVCSIDTLYTDFKIKQEAKRNDSLSKLKYWRCGTGLVNQIENFDINLISCEEIKSIIDLSNKTTHNTGYN